MKILAGLFRTSLATAALLATCEAHAQASKAVQATEFHFLNDVIAMKAADRRIYLLLGSGFLRAIRFGDPTVFESKWLLAHPTAVATPISRMLSTNTRTGEQQELVYIWVEDGASSLNVDLVRAGIFPGAAMYDMVDNERGLDELLKDPKLADARAEIAKERAAAPQDRTDRLVSDTDYKARMTRIGNAERQARAEKLGIWSDAMKAEREADGAQ